jgi:hypothetical protein
MNVVRGGPHVSKKKQDMANNKRKQTKVLAFGVNDDDEAKVLVLPPIDGGGAPVPAVLPPVEKIDQRKFSALDAQLIERFRAQKASEGKTVQKR